MKIPKQKFNFTYSWKSEPHSYDEIKTVINGQDFMDVDTSKSIEKDNGYIVQLEGWSYDVETIDYPDGTVFNNATHFDFERKDYVKV
jgi:Na+-transporting NADH:ubiquinone oxidoreductase subunit NqrF